MSPREWQVLAGIALFDDRFDDPEPVIAGLTDDLDYGQFVLLAMRHTLMPAVADFLTRFGVRPRPLARGWGATVGALHWNRARAAAMTTEAARVVAAFRAAGIRVACTKGSSLQHRLYDGRGTRFFSDVDLLVTPESREATAATLRDLGYQAATGYSNRRGAIVPLSKTRQAVYRMAPDHLPPFNRLSGDPAIPFFAVDVANSITWTASPWELPVAAALEAVDTIAVPATDGSEPVELAVLTPAYDFLLTVLHLFREAWFQRTAQTKDVRLSQFADVLRYWRRYDSAMRPEVLRLLAAHDLAAPVAWVGAHTDAVFGSSIVDSLGLRSDADAEWLGTVRNASGGLLRWHGDMVGRMQEPELVLTPVAGDAVDDPGGARANAR